MATDQIISRFAPAPTGFLHLGHVVNALHVWGLTRALCGRVLLRIEDHDRQRSRPEYEQAILEDLEWLGFVPDDPPVSAFRTGTCHGRQRDRQEIYRAALAVLREGSDSREPGEPGTLYACDCTRRELREAMEQASGPLAPDVELRYSGRCARRGLPWGEGLGLRVCLEDTIERFVDLRHGLQEQRPFEQCGDLLLRDRDGNWTYQFAVTVDDMEQGVNLVVRGDDLLASTGRQLLLSRMLGREEPPRFLHHGLIMKSATQKLSKADRDTSVREMRASGARVEDVIGGAVYAAGLTARIRPLDRNEAEALVSARYGAPSQTDVGSSWDWRLRKD